MSDSQGCLAGCPATPSLDGGTRKEELTRGIAAPDDSSGCHRSPLSSAPRQSTTDLGEHERQRAHYVICPRGLCAAQRDGRGGEGRASGPDHRDRPLSPQRTRRHPPPRPHCQSRPRTTQRACPHSCRYRGASSRALRRGSRPRAPHPACETGRGAVCAFREPGRLRARRGSAGDGRGAQPRLGHSRSCRHSHGRARAPLCARPGGVARARCVPREPLIGVLHFP